MALHFLSSKHIRTVPTEPLHRKYETFRRDHWLSVISGDQLLRVWNLRSHENTRKANEKIVTDPIACAMPTTHAAQLTASRHKSSRNNSDALLDRLNFLQE